MEDFKQISFRYYGFSVAINPFLWTVGKRVCITRMGTSRNYSTYTII